MRPPPRPSQERIEEIRRILAGVPQDHAYAIAQLELLAEIDALTEQVAQLTVERDEWKDNERVTSELFEAASKDIEALHKERDHFRDRHAKLREALVAMKSRIPDSSFPNECDGGDTWLLDSSQVERWIDKTLAADDLAATPEKEDE